MRTTPLITWAALSCLLACGAADSSGTGPKHPVTPGEAVYKINCVMCHGRDGGLKMGGAKDLRQSTLGKEEMIAIVTTGKGGMAGFGHLLSTQQIEDVVGHVRTLKAAP